MVGTVCGDSSTPVTLLTQFPTSLGHQVWVLARRACSAVSVLHFRDHLIIHKLFCPGLYGPWHLPTSEVLILRSLCPH